MSTTSNPLLFALRDLGTSVRTVFQDEASRRQAALAAQSQENEQRRALESLRLTGEQQLAKLGIEEAKTRFDIGKGGEELALRGREVTSREQLATQQIAASAAEQQRATELQPHLIATQQAHQAAARAQQAAAQSQQLKAAQDIKLGALQLREAETEEKRLNTMAPLASHLNYRVGQLVGETGGQGAAEPVSIMGAQLQALGYDPTDTTPISGRDADRIAKLMSSIDPTMKLLAVKNARLNQIQQLPTDDPRRKILQQNFDTLFGPNKDLNTLTRVYDEELRQGRVPEGVSFKDWQIGMGARDPEPGYTTTKEVLAWRISKLGEKEAKALSAAPPLERTKLLQTYLGDAIAARQRVGDVNTLQKLEAEYASRQSGSPPPVPAPTEGALAPAASSGRPDPVTMLRSAYQQRIMAQPAVLSALTRLGYTREAAIAVLTPDTKSAINAAIRGEEAAPFTAEQLRDAVQRKDVVPSAAFNLLVERFRMSRDQARAFLQGAP